MATTRIMPVHAIKELGTGQTIKSVMDYVKNPKKTSDGLSITAFECDVDIAAEDFMLARDEYIFRTGREQKENEILAYHVRQAFKPGEIAPEKALEVTYDLAMRWTKGRHAFVVTTHIDRAHVHSHIVFNSTNLNCDGKFRDFKRSGRALRRLSDMICLENGLSVI